MSSTGHCTNGGARDVLNNDAEAAKVDPAPPAAPVNDPQLERALEYLQKKLGKRPEPVKSTRRLRTLQRDASGRFDVLPSFAGQEERPCDAHQVPRRHEGLDQLPRRSWIGPHVQCQLRQMAGLLDRLGLTRNLTGSVRGDCSDSESGLRARNAAAIVRASRSHPCPGSWQTAAAADRARTVRIDAIRAAIDAGLSRYPGSPSVTSRESRCAPDSGPEPGLTARRFVQTPPLTVQLAAGGDRHGGVCRLVPSEQTDGDSVELPPHAADFFPIIQAAQSVGGGVRADVGVRQVGDIVEVEVASQRQQGGIVVAHRLFNHAERLGLGHAADGRPIRPRR